MVDLDAQRAEFSRQVSELAKGLHRAIDEVENAQQKQYTLEIRLLRESAKREEAERRAKVSEDKLSAAWVVIDEWLRRNIVTEREHEELREAVARAGYDNGIDGVGE